MQIQDHPGAATAAPATLLPADAPAVTIIKVLTVNIHKGFSPLNRRFVMPELRDAMRCGRCQLTWCFCRKYLRMLRSTCRAAMAGRNSPDTQRYFRKTA
jgi:hypothetical protein